MHPSGLNNVATDSRQQAHQNNLRLPSAGNKRIRAVIVD
jgi:hypothetical protein